MNIDSFLIKLVLLVVPGYFGYSLACILRTSSPADMKETQSIRFLNIFLFTIISYILFDLSFMMVYALGGPKRDSILNLFYSNQYVLSSVDLLLLMGFSSVIGVIYALVENRGVIYKLFQFLKITRNSSKTDVWSHIVKSEKFDWVIVRDYDNELTYFGHIERFSETDNARELLLWDVDVFAAGKEKRLYHSDYIYLSRDAFRFSIEVNSTK